MPDSRTADDRTTDERTPSPTIALLTLSRTAEVEMSRVLEPHALSVRKFGILSRIAAMPGTSVADLARRLSLDAADLAPMLRALQDAGLTRAGDERSATVTITPAGVRLLGTVSAEVAAVDERLFPEADEARSALAVALLTAFAEPLGEPQD
ncbi:MAG: MarR family transcriptional regulator [Pseudolysinimonas sp.]